MQKRPVTVTAMDQTTALNGAVQTGPEYAVLEGAVEGHTLAEISLTADPAAYAGTFRESITPSGAKIVDENGQDVTENYAVTYVKGSLTVEKGSISFVPPTAKDLTADGTDMELVEGGYADGGFLYYALGSNELEEPAPDQYSPYVPEAAAPGTYYVWCKAVGDASHEDSAAVCVTATVKISVPKTVITGLFDAGSGNLRFYWRSLGDQVDGYQIRWSLTRDMSAKVKTASYTGKNRATRPGLLLGQTYYCNVRTYKYVDGVKQYSIWSGTKQIVLKRTLPAPRLVSAQSGNGGLRTEWDTAEGVDGYQIQYCEDPSFHGAKSASVKNPLKSAFTKKNLSGGTTWYVRVRSYKRLEGDGRRYYSAWSEVYTVEM